MKWIQLLVLISLITAPGVWASPQKKSEKSLDLLGMTLQKYKNDGYQITGPVQYLGKTKSKIRFFRRPPVTFTRLKMILPNGETTILKKYDFVYLLYKHKNIVLLRIEKKERDHV